MQQQPRIVGKLLISFYASKQQLPDRTAALTVAQPWVAQHWQQSVHAPLQVDFLEVLMLLCCLTFSEIVLYLRFWLHASQPEIRTEEADFAVGKFQVSWAMLHTLHSPLHLLALSPQTFRVQLSVHSISECWRSQLGWDVPGSHLVATWLGTLSSFDEDEDDDHHYCYQDTDEESHYYLWFCHIITCIIACIGTFVNSLIIILWITLSL